MKINIAVVDDSKPYSRVMEALLKGLKSDLGVECDIEVFNTATEYRASTTTFDIVIIDCILKSEQSNINGIMLADLTKLKNKDAKVILISGHADQEFLRMFKLYSTTVDFYCSKKMENNELVYKIIEYVKELKISKKNKEVNTMVRVHVYKIGKEWIKFSDINYARVADREKHLIAVGTAQGEKLLSMTISGFVNQVNEALQMEGIDKEEKKLRTDLFVNFSNVVNLDKKAGKLNFKNNRELALEYLTANNAEAIEQRLKERTDVS